jgi:hypothetical protein
VCRVARGPARVGDSGGAGTRAGCGKGVSVVRRGRSIFVQLSPALMPAAPAV